MVETKPMRLVPGSECFRVLSKPHEITVGNPSSFTLEMIPIAAMRILQILTTFPYPGVCMLHSVRIANINTLVDGSMDLYHLNSDLQNVGAGIAVTQANSIHLEGRYDGGIPQSLKRGDRLTFSAWCIGRDLALEPKRSLEDRTAFRSGITSSDFGLDKES